MKKIIGILPVFILLMVIVPVFAQNSNQTQVSEEEIEREIQEEKLKQQEALKDAYKEGEIASCSDYYTNGNVQINLTQDYTAYDAGRPVLIRGTVKNTNTYPIIGVDIKARLVKDIPAPDKMRAEIMILDEFDIAENITIDAQGEYALSYSYLLPYNAPSGEYQMYFYAVEQDKFNLSGLPATNNIVGSKISFDVKGNIRDHTYLDQTQIMVGEQKYNVMGDTLIGMKDSQIPITIPLYNPEQDSKTMTITYDLYVWDAVSKTNKIETKTEQVTIEPQSEKILTYTIKKAEEPSYYLSITAKPTNQTKKESIFREKSISNINLLIQDVAKPRITFVTTNSYPLKKGEEATLITCFDTPNTIEENQSISKIETILKDENGREITRTLFEGKITQNISAIANTFKPKVNSVNYTIESIIYDQNNTIIDKVEKAYTCEDINKEMCSEKTSKIPQSILVLSIAILALIGMLFIKNKSTIERV